MTKRLRSVLPVAIALLIMGGAVYYFGFVNPQLWQLALSRITPCQQPITYSIGTFDARFGISKATFIKDISDAEAIWEKSINRPLFTYVEKGGALTINLIYDARQASTIKLQRLGIIIRDDQAGYDKLKAQYNTLQATYKQKKAALDVLVASFEARQKSYAAAVAYWNARHGAPPSEYQTLQQEQSALQALANQINAKEADINQTIDTLNSMVAVLNRLATSLNQQIVNFNGTGLVGQGEFQEGEYVSGSNVNEINIYQFDNQTKLVRVLAHELGHALGLPHIDNPQAIMYRLNNGVNEKLTADDLALLKAQCHLK